MGTKARRRWTWLHEEALGGGRVDVERGVISGVRVLGLSSTNDRRYEPEAVRRAVPLYQGIKVFVDHPPRKDGPNASRSSNDVIGQLKNVRFVEGKGLYGDLHLLRSHPLTRRVLEAAQHMPNAYGLSHNAHGNSENRDGTDVITSIESVRSVDLVSEPATSGGLYESSHRSRHRRQVREDQQRRAAAPRIPHGTEALARWLLN